MNSQLSDLAEKAQRKRQAQQTDYDLAENDDMYVTRSRSSVRRYIQPVQHDTLDDPILQKGGPISRRARARTGVAAHAPASASAKRLESEAEAEESTTTENAAEPGERSSAPGIHSRVPRQQRFPLITLLVGMVLMALLVFAINVLAAWWNVYQDDLHYGRPRTFQLDAMVGHGDSASNPTHFIFMNLNRHVEIIELPGGDASHAKIYPGPILYGTGQDLTPVTAQIRDINGDGKLDIIIHIQDQQLILINTGSDFRPLQPGENIHP